MLNFNPGPQDNGGLVDQKERFSDDPPVTGETGRQAVVSGRMTRLFRSIMEFGSGFPSTLCELVENIYTRGSVTRSPAGAGAGLSEILSDESRVVGTGVGYDIGAGLRVQGFGVFDMDDNSAFAGPALRFNVQEYIDLTTGMQLLINEDESRFERQGLYFAEFRFQF
ncbi:MAG TPA: hypothetical protein DDW94_09780 [Deltaproteobacteria bacterium]|nr:MAG: hypothetical protein A2Z79_12380 [Deltaproteobacteria bacterium GWA2_55_82]HBG47260.1 hypothetical protein [Deltaproteobacteria bacterium]HCY10026.1 hypothetical protein [Deltaproteobacteria bacterium]